MRYTITSTVTDHVVHGVEGWQVADAIRGWYPEPTDDVTEATAVAASPVLGQRHRGGHRPRPRRLVPAVPVRVDHEPGQVVVVVDNRQRGDPGPSARAGA